MGLFFKKTKPDEELAEKGLRGTATVLHVERSGMAVSMSMSNDKAEEMLRGDVSPIRRKVRLRVEVPGREAYEVATKLNVPVMLSGRLVAGSGVSVMVDPDDPKHLAVDWSAGIQAGSPSAMFQDNPMATAVLQGMGIDPQQLAQRIEQAQAQAQAYLASQGGQPGTWPVPPAAWPAQGQMSPGTPQAGQVPPGSPAPAGWPVPLGTPPLPPGAPSNTPHSEAPATSPGGWPEPQEWPEPSPQAEGPTSEDPPKE